MKKLYEKSKLGFALTWIGIYCLLQSLAYPLNRLIGVKYSASAALCLLQGAVIFRFIQKNGLMERYGLCGTPFPASRFLYYLPLVLLASRNFWNGAAVNLSAGETACYILCMLGVGFVEEAIFRGFLFRALARDNVKTAVVISSVTFGLGHLLNLVNGSGASLLENIFQVTGAIAIGFLFVVLFNRGGSLVPCVVTHAAINISSAFANEAGLTVEKRLVFHAALFAVTIAYAAVLIRLLPQKRDAIS